MWPLAFVLWEEEDEVVLAAKPSNSLEPLRRARSIQCTLLLSELDVGFCLSHLCVLLDERASRLVMRPHSAMVV
jgi:hypothetical protein